MDHSTRLLDLWSLPRTAWQFYVDNLWNWTDHPGSWVSRIAYTSRVLAILLILPVVVLILLDLASYGIARTLGVIDDVKASTSDKQTVHGAAPLVQIFEHPATPDSATLMGGGGGGAVDAGHQYGSSSSSSSLGTLPPLGAFTPLHPPAYFTSEENSLKLSGVGVFSPAASRPPSPTITRRTLPPEDKLADADDGIVFRKRATNTSKEQT